jgi:hypothetical protein
MFIRLPCMVVFVLLKIFVNSLNSNHAETDLKAVTLPIGNGTKRRDIVRSNARRQIPGHAVSAYQKLRLLQPGNNCQLSLGRTVRKN